MCHVSEFDSKRIEDPESHFEAGQDLEFKVLKLNLLDRKIGLSVKALKEETVEKEPSWSYTPEVATTSIGDIAGKELDGLKKKAEQATNPRMTNLRIRKGPKNRKGPKMTKAELVEEVAKTQI